jgi:hypothetical protein
MTGFCQGCFRLFGLGFFIGGMGMGFASQTVHRH